MMGIQPRAKGAASARMLRQVQAGTRKGLADLKVHHTTPSTGQGLGSISETEGWAEQS